MRKQPPVEPIRTGVAAKVKNATAAISKTTVTARTSRRQTPQRNTTAPIDPALRQRMIAEAAYYKALQRGFSTGLELQDWLDAEREIDARKP